MPFAGFSPSWEAVLVQTEHWALLFSAAKSKKASASIVSIFFIAAKLQFSGLPVTLV